MTPPTCECLVGDCPSNAVLRVDGHVADVGQRGGQLDDQVTGQDSHHHLGRWENWEGEKEINNIAILLLLTKSHSVECIVREVVTPSVNLIP